MRQVNMFENTGREEPLAARLRPRTLDEYAGQQHLVGRERRFGG